jgi:hypothetical protein
MHPHSHATALAHRAIAEGRGIGAARLRGIIADIWLKTWTANFRAEVLSSVSPVDADGILRIRWPERVDGSQPDMEVILATATRAEATQPTVDDIADAWVNQEGGHERYFFENVRHGIRTAEDGLIWRGIEERAPPWLQSRAYDQAVSVLRAEIARPV